MRNEIPITEDALSPVIRALVKDVNTAISLNQLMRATHYDDRLTNAFDNSYEIHAFTLMQGAITYSLCTNLMRLFDPNPRDRNTACYSRILCRLNAESEGDFRQCIRERRARHVEGRQLKEEVESAINDLNEAKGLYREVRESHQLQRVMLFRNTVIAHTALDKRAAHVQPPPQLGDLSFLVGKARNIVDLIGGPLIDETYYFVRTVEYFERFSESLSTALALGMEQLTESGDTIQCC